MILHNPDMGWMIYENHIIDPGPGGVSDFSATPTETLAAADNVAIMFAWSDVERSPGVYDFSTVDAAYDFWKQRGKKIMLRMSTESLLFWANNKPPGGKGIPDHVLANISPQHKQIRTTDDLKYTVVDARDPAYTKPLEKFLHAAAAHFNRDRPVTMIDLRGYGVWGEWHSGYQYESVAARHAALSGIIDCWVAAFPDHYLALSFSYDPAGPAEYYEGPGDRFDPAFTKHVEEYVHYSAFDYAMTKPNVTLRRDGAGGAVHSNERLLNDREFQTAAKGPMCCEFVTGYSDAKPGGAKWLRFLVDDALSLHPNYINLLGWSGGEAMAFTREQPDLINYGLQNMGYRLLPTSIAFDTQIISGQPFHIKMTWINRGVGRAIRDHHLILMLEDQQGREITRRDAGAIDLKHLLKSQEYTWSGIVNWNHLSAGQFTLRMSLEEEQDKTLVALPLQGDQSHHRYSIGQVDAR